MAGYIGTKAVNLSTTGADINGNANVDGTLDVTGPFTSLGIDDNAAATAVTIAASGNVGIGTASPEVQLETFGAAQTYNFNAGTDPLANFAIINNNINSGTGPAIVLGSTYSGSSTVANARIFAERQSTGGTNAGATDLIFEVGQASGSALAERMRIDSSGNLLVGTTASSTKSAAASGVDIGTEVRAAGTFITHTTGENLLLNSDSGVNVRFYKGGAYSGAITTTGTTTSYVTSSDYRLKENITPIQGAGDIVKAMQPVTYTFKSDGSWHDGFLAHELQELHPRAVIGEKDAMKDEEYEVTPAVEATFDEEGSELTPAVPAVMGTHSVPGYQGVDYSKLTPILTAALQEALNKIDALEARLTALEATT